MKRNFKFKLKQRVWWHDDPERKGLICAIVLNPYDETYRVQWSPSDSSEHYSHELSAVKPEIEFE